MSSRQTRVDADRPIEGAELDEAISALFTSPLGVLVLESLRARTIEMPVARPERDAQYAFFREGQNDIIRQIQAAMLRVKLGVHKQQEDDPHAGRDERTDPLAGY